MVEVPSKELKKLNLTTVYTSFDFFNLLENLQNSYEYWEQKAEIEQQKTQEKINNLENQTNNMDCENNQMWCMANDLEIKKLEAQKNITQNKSAWWIKAAYEFISNLPLISLEPQKVKFNLPWVDKRTIDKAIADLSSIKDIVLDDE